MLVRGTVALLVTLSACGDDRPPNVVGTDERARLEAALAARVAAVRTRCPTPDAALRAFAEPTGELAACVDRIRPVRYTRRRLDREPAIVASAFACGPLIDATVTAAAAQDAACSPYVLSEPPPDDVMSFVPEFAFADVIIERARQHADAGDTTRALVLLADAVRAEQHLARGPVSLLRVMISKHICTILVDAALALLETHAPTNDAIIAKVDAAIARDPSVIDSLVADADHVAMYMRPSSPDDVASLLAHTDETRRATATACPADPPMTLRACHAALRAISPSPASDARGFHHELVRSTTRALDQVEEDRRQAVVGDGRDYAGIGSSYVARAAEHLTTLVAWRIALEVARTGRCPSTADLAALLSPPLLGDSIGVTVTAAAIEVRPPAWARAEPRLARPRSIRCP